MRRSAIVAVTAAAALTVGAAVAAAPAEAQKKTGTDRFGTHRTLNVKDLKVKPLGLDPARQVGVVVRVAGASVSEAKAARRALGRSLSRHEATLVRNRAAATQRSVARTVRAKGGHVQRQYFDALNGLSVTIPASQVAALRATRGVTSVDLIRSLTRDNTRSNLYTGAAAAWGDFGATGAGVKVAIIDTGIDYTHADFGGAGTPEAFKANDGLTVGPGIFPTAKVVAGYDFVGDAYNPSGGNAVPVPDPNPLDCEGHGSHVAGTAAGGGVNADGTPYTGPYTSAAVQAAGLKIGPGSAPEASLMAYRVFGCAGDVNDDIVIAAIDRAVKDGANVVNMSLGSPYGDANTAEAATIDNASKAGVMMVISAGNDGHAPYLVGGPSTSRTALSVAAMDANATFAGATIAVGSSSFTAINANKGPLPVNAALAVVGDGAGGISLGCTVADFGNVTGKIAVVKRGTCARVDKAKNGAAAGAVAVVMVNNDTGLPPFEGDIAGVTIPFLGVASGDGAGLLAVDGQAANVTATDIANPTFAQSIGFTSGGPRSGDAGVKPDLSAPGVSLFSAAVGTGAGGIVESGTSMAAPHTAGIAALVRQKHPTWDVNTVKAALVDTASYDPTVLTTDIRVAGNGLVQPLKALATNVVIYSSRGETGLSFGVAEQQETFTGEGRLTVRNTGNRPVRLDLSTALEGNGRGAVLSVSPRSVTVSPGTRTLEVSLRLNRAAIAALPAAGSTADGIVVVKGRVIATQAGGTTLTVPVQVVPYGRSDIKAEASKSAIKLVNEGVHAGDADFYEWLASDGRDSGAAADLRAVGAQSFDLGPDHLVVFAVNGWNKFSNPAEMEYDIYLDSNNDGTADHLLFATDSGLVETGSSNGQLGAYAVDLVTGAIGSLGAAGPVDGSTVEIAAYAGDLGITATSGPTRVIGVQSQSLVRGLPDTLATTATVNVWDPQRSMGDFVSLASRGRATVPTTSRRPIAGEVRSPGWMVVTLDDHSGASQADLVRPEN